MYPAIGCRFISYLLALPFDLVTFFRPWIWKALPTPPPLKLWQHSSLTEVWTHENKFTTSTETGQTSETNSSLNLIKKLRVNGTAGGLLYPLWHTNIVINSTRCWNYSIRGRLLWFVGRNIEAVVKELSRMWTTECKFMPVTYINFSGMCFLFACMHIGVSQ